MAKYAILIYGDEERWRSQTSEEVERLQAAHGAFQKDAPGTVLAGHELEDSATATSLRRGDGGRPTVTDGPFLETKEVLGGLYLVEAPDLDAVIQWAGRLQEVSDDHSGVEIRPIAEPS